ncbi:MAG TPA: imidazole glycerol phosphate synthase cyclase subunit [Polyangia bacterium]|nr:imidazole glycerol phosphate synthase cyclase subunit [Polyangia bacterium]
MLKTRMIPCLLLKNGLLVRSEEFSLHQVVGNPIHQVERFNAWAVDELIYIDITREGAYDVRRDDQKVKASTDVLEIIEGVAKACFMPLTFGGRIRTIDDINARLAHGADKVTINTIALDSPEFVDEAAREFGSQAIIVSIDAKERDAGGWEAMAEGGRRASGRGVVEWAREAERRGAGEIFLNSIDRDGIGEGYDTALIKAVSEATTIPVIACGGVGRFEHLTAGVKAGASAVSAANIFHFTEHSTQRAKAVLHDAGVDVRLAGVGAERAPASPD